MKWYASFTSQWHTQRRATYFEKANRLIWCSSSRKALCGALEVVLVPWSAFRKADHYGKQLVEWQLSSTSYSEFPISEAKLKCHTKVEVFALMAIDLEHLLSSFWGNFPPAQPNSRLRAWSLSRLLRCNKDFGIIFGREGQENITFMSRLIYGSTL